MILYKKIGLTVFILALCLTNLFFVHQDVLAEGNVYDSYQSDLKDEEDASATKLQDGEELIESDQDFLAPMERSKSGFLLIIQIIFYLIIVLVMIYGLIKFLSIKQRKIGHHQLFQTLGGISLGSNKSLQLVKVGGVYYLIGVGDHISLIKEIRDPDEISTIEKDLAEQESIISKGLINLLSPKSGTDQQDGGKHSFQSMFKESLRQQKNRREVFGENWGSETEINKEGKST